MFDWVPIQSYTTIYYYVCLVTVLVLYLNTLKFPVLGQRYLTTVQALSYPFFFLVLLYMGFRPLSGVFTDMTTYGNIFVRYQNGQSIEGKDDFLFHLFVKTIATIGNLDIFFFLCAVVYCVPIYFACVNFFKKNWFYGFIILATSFSFWAYGTNGIRNGMAGSLFLLGLSQKTKFKQAFWIIIAINIHFSMILPALAFFASKFDIPNKLYFRVWILSIVLSLVGGGFWETFFAGIGFGDDRLSYLTEDSYNDKFSNTGFRWDFLIYSASAVFAGWYYIVKLKFNDRVYLSLLGTYLLTNAFWILVIRASFSNRFAYLSWFMMGLIIIYPLLKSKMLVSQNRVIGIILISYFAFTFFMNVILK
ncbi:EpsG family protein [Sphingobacterium faecium]|uniref:EpsG family protein n=1 Tax=Sphingobacterium faecium TaxID=34087 RepID=UPI00320AAE22